MSIKFSKSSENNTLSSLLRERFGERVQENCSISSYVKSGVGGVAEYLIEATSVEEITAACQIAATARRPSAVLGSGTGTVASQVGALGLVVINQAMQINFAKENSLVVVESGATNASLISAAASRGLGGLEFLIGIPGTVGGAVATDASYQSKSLGSFIRSVVLWVAEGDASRVIALGYSEAKEILDSAHAQPSGIPRPVILAVHLQFSRLYPDEILRRLSGFRHRSTITNSAQSLIGRPFVQSFAEYPLLRKNIDRIRHGGLRYDVANDVVRASRLPVQPEEIRSYIATIKSIASEQGVTLADRLTYLGYWPDEGADESI